jgi:alkanesulfonate monooxygenase SsuD/methylene tetrahydromethanopterin reductase-like flavin-dependent oxidoreductase (luciferase family)
MELVETADAAGLDGVWSCEQVGFRDAVVSSAMAAARTRRLEIGLVGVSTATRHPGLLAMELASLAELAPGRTRIAVGAGDPGLLAKLGRRVEAPLSSTRTLVRTLRDALAGRVLDGDHGGFRFEGFRLNGAPLPVAIDVMAVRPRMLAMAAAEADGVALSMGSTPGVLRESVEAVEAALRQAGRPRDGFRIGATCMVAVGRDLDAARRIVRGVVSMAEPEMAELLARDVLPRGTLVREGAAALPDETVDQLALVAKPDDLGGALERYAATGIDELALFLLAPPAEQPALVQRLAGARPGR